VFEFALFLVSFLFETVFSCLNCPSFLF